MSFFCFYTRLRLKKEFEDFKNHPEYNNFVREECISSSSSSDDEDDESSFGKETSLHSDHYRRSEEEDLEHVVPRGLWSGGKAPLINSHFTTNWYYIIKILVCSSWS